MWVDFECRYDNPDDRAIIEGPGADDEMCMFVGGYYPRTAVPFGETCTIRGGSGPIFHGTRTCAESLGCLSEATDRVGAQACWDATREEDSGRLVDLAWQCASDRCSEVCDRRGIRDGCMTCLAERCGLELDQCTTGP